VVDDSFDVVRNDHEHRYEARVDDRVAGFVTFTSTPGHITLVHTEVDRAFEHHGIASRLIGDTLDDLRARGVAVTPRCPFVAEYIRTHPEYADLVGSGPAG
jgi:uncharacterized protein